MNIYREINGHKVKTFQDNTASLLCAVMRNLTLCKCTVEDCKNN